MKSYEVEPGPWHKRCQALHEFQWRHHDVGGAVPIRAFQLQHDIAGTVEFEPFIGDGGAGDIAAQLFELIAENSYYKRPFLSISKVPYTRSVATHTGHWPEIVPFCTLKCPISQQFC